QVADRAGPQDGVEIGEQLVGHSIDRDVVGRTDRPAGAMAVGQDVGKAGNEVGNVGRVTAVATTLQFGGDDVDATLRHAPHVREAVFDRLSLGPHRANVVD